VSAPTTSLPPPIFAPLAAFPEGRPVISAAKARDWPRLSQRFAELTDPATHRRAIRLASEAAELDFLEEVFAAEPTSALAGTLLGNRLIGDGWKIRTDSRAKNVSREQWKGFHAHLNRAEQVLIEVTARHPGYASAWMDRLTVARGISLGQAEARRRYDRLNNVAPHCYPAQSSMIQQLCPKWSGSYEAMRSFAVECTQASPPGSVNGGLVAEAHIEHWLELDSGANYAYLNRPDVQRELLWAARHSVLNRAFRPATGWVSVHSVFALVFSLSQNYPAAVAHFQALYAGGNLADEWMWEYLGDPLDTFVANRERAYQSGLGR
jgi:hypothetical protein